MKSSSLWAILYNTSIFTALVAVVSTSLFLILSFRNPEVVDYTRSLGGGACLGLRLRSDHEFGWPTLRRAGLLADTPLRTAGCSSHSFIVTGAYRVGPARWTVLGLSPTHLYRYTPNTVSFNCEWVDAGNVQPPVLGNSTTARRVRFDKPGGDWFPRTYIPIVIDCNFPLQVGTHGRGGALVLHVLGPRVGGQAWGWSGQFEEDEWMSKELHHIYTKHGTVNAALVEALRAELPQAVEVDVAHAEAPVDEQEGGVEVIAVTEKAHQYERAQYETRTTLYDNLYCGSSIFGNLDVLAVNEWLSYHLHFFGANRTHFVFHDAGAVGGNKEMEKALEHWIQLGLLTIHDFQQLQMYEGYYHHQYLVINDCLHRYKFVAERIWFFDVDEYMLFRPPNSLQSILERYQDKDVLLFSQRKFSDKLCRRPNNASLALEPGQSHLWTMETMLFAKEADKEVERKFVVLNPRKMFTVVVHAGWEPRNHKARHLDLQKEAGFYHYHDTITKNKSALCGLWLEPTATRGQAHTTPRTDVLHDWEYDDGILVFAAAAKKFIRAFFASKNMSSLV